MADPSTALSLWASIIGWFTPTALFLFVNLVIGIIAITSRFTSYKKPPPHDSPHLVRAPSLLDRVKSIDFSLYKFPQYRNPEEETPYFPPSTEPVHDSNPVDPYPPQLQRGPSLIERVRSFNFSSIYNSQQQHPEIETEVIDNSVSEPVSDPNPGPDWDPDNQPKRSKSETKKTARKVRESVKKSASEKSMMVGEAEEKTEAVERRRPETTRPDRITSFGDGDEGVDAKADDFIDKFRKELKLQRLDSLLRYKEMLSGK